MIFRRMTRYYKGNSLATAGTVVTFLIFAMAICAPLIIPYDDAVRTQFLLKFTPPTWGHLMGTDALGRDVLAQIVWGSRASLEVGFAGTIFSTVLGSIVGLAAGYYGGWVDSAAVYAIDVMMAFPLLLLALVMVAMLGANMTNIVIAVGIAWAPRTARLVRSLALELRTQEYVEAARSAGARGPRIMVRHIFLNAVGPIIVNLTLGLAAVIIVEASLSFLGLGPPSIPTWGRVIADGEQYLRDAPWISIFPGVAILVTVLALNVMGDGLRDKLDPRTRNDS